MPCTGPTSQGRSRAGHAGRGAAGIGRQRRRRCCPTEHGGRRDAGEDRALDRAGRPIPPARKRPPGRPANPTIDTGTPPPRVPPQAHARSAKRKPVARPWDGLSHIPRGTRPGTSATPGSATGGSFFSPPPPPPPPIFIAGSASRRSVNGRYRGRPPARAVAAAPAGARCVGASHEPHDRGVAPTDRQPGPPRARRARRTPRSAGSKQRQGKTVDYTPPEEPEKLALRRSTEVSTPPGPGDRPGENFPADMIEEL